MDLYYKDISPPSRAVLLTGKALGIEFNKKEINPLVGEQNEPEYLAINFQHTIPTIVDGDFTLWESRAICAYLVNAHGEDDSLYPADPKTRAMIDRLLYFDEGTLFSRLGKFIFPVVFQGEAPDPVKLESINGALEFLETFLDGHDFAVGDSITIADHCLVATFSTIDAVGRVDTSKYTNILAWFERCKEQMPGYEEENAVGANAFGEMIKAKFAEHE